MKIELIMLIIIGGVAYHIYTDGKWLNMVTNYKKQLQIGGVIVVGLFIYWLIKYNPMMAGKLLVSGKEYTKFLPIDSGVSSFLSPAIDFTGKWIGATSGGGGGGGRQMAGITKMENSGANSTKRSVSETKKRYVSAQQNWKCAICQNTLTANYEIDHITPLSSGGTNHVENLRSLCPECHRTVTVANKMI
jgi:hypothetical protein